MFCGGETTFACHGHDLTIARTGGATGSVEFSTRVDNRIKIAETRCFAHDRAVRQDEQRLDKLMP